MLMTAALERLADAPEGFLLQVEAARVDHAAHANDPAACLMEQLEFDRCIRLARRFAAEHPETLVVITTDHGTGGFMLNGEGKAYNGSTEGLLRLGACTRSFEALCGRHRKQPLSGTEIARNLGLPARPFAGAIDEALKDWDGAPKSLGGRLREVLAPFFAVSWTTQNHTGELAEFASFGPGADTFPGFFENWEVHHILREVLAI
jgi:alkaline phosphatase